MLITLTYQGPDPKLLAGLLQLDPDGIHAAELPFGKAITFFPQLSPDLSEVTLLLEVAQERLLQEGPFTGAGHPLRQFVNARAYSSNALLSLAIAKVFEKAIAAADKTKLELEILIAAVETELEPAVLQSWFRPLGWHLKVEQQPRDAKFPEWGLSHCVDLRLKGKQTVADALQHLQVLICALDRDHIYSIGEAATQSILEMAQSVLQKHPHENAIKTALVSYPPFEQRNRLGSLFEEDDEAHKVHFHPNLHDAAKNLALYMDCKPWMLDPKFPKVLLVMAEDGTVPIHLAAESSVAHVTMTHLEFLPLQRIAHQVNASHLTEEHKRKMSLLPSSPLMKNEVLLGYDIVVVQNIHRSFAAWHHSAIESMVFGYLGAKRIVWLGAENEPLENWASNIAKGFPFTVQILTHAEGDMAMQFAIFDATETN